MAAIKNELSKNSENWISKHRYLELQHFCLQYSERAKAANDILTKSPEVLREHYGKTNDVSDPVSFAAIKREHYLKKNELIRQTCKDVCGDTGVEYFLLCSVTARKTYDQMSMKNVIPVGRNTFFKFYRRFFWELDKRM